MPIQISELSMATAGDSSSDVFLHLQTKRAGKVKGEVATAGHADDIAVVAWSWGVSAASAIGTSTTSARRSYKSLVVCKRIDAASTALLSALATNDEIKEATLTARRAGGEALDYYAMTIKGGRVTDIEFDVDASGRTIEKVSLSFTEVEVAYQKQQGGGGSGGTSTFTDKVLPG